MPKSYIMQTILKKIIITLLVLPSLLLYVQEGETRELSLKEAVETALKSNLNLQLKTTDIEAAAGALSTEKGVFDVLLTAQASATQKQLTPLAPNGIGEEKKNIWKLGAEKIFSTGTHLGVNWSNSSYRNDLESLIFDPALRSGVNITIQQPLLKGLGQKVQQAGQHSAEKSIQAATSAAASERVELAARVKKAYWQLVFTRENLKAGQLSLQLAEQLLAETQEQIKAGRRAKIDIYQPEAEIALRNQELIAAEKAISEAEDHLKLLMGIQTAGEWEERYLPVSTPQASNRTPESGELFANALQNRPDVQAAKQYVEATNYTLLQARDQLRPALDLIGGYGIAATSDSYDNSITESFENPKESWDIGLRFTMPLHNDHAKGSMQKARARKTQAETKLQYLQQQVQLEVRAALRDIRLAEKTVSAAKKTTLTSKKQLEAERTRFTVGRATTFDVLTAQQKYSSALSRQARSEAEQAIAIAELERIQGRIFSDYR